MQRTIIPFMYFPCQNKNAMEIFRGFHGRQLDTLVCATASIFPVLITAWTPCSSSITAGHNDPVCFVLVLVVLTIQLNMEYMYVVLHVLVGFPHSRTLVTSHNYNIPFLSPCSASMGSRRCNPISILCSFLEPFNFVILQWVHHMRCTFNIEQWGLIDHYVF
jgi:hypothetical protein